MALLEKLLEAIKLDDNGTFTEDKTSEYAAKYLLCLRDLVENFEITDTLADLPASVATSEPSDRFWLEQLQKDAFSDNSINILQWLREERIAHYFGDIKKLPSHKVMQLNLADDLVLLFAETRRIELEKHNQINYGLEVDSRYIAERKEIRERLSIKDSLVLQNISAKKTTFNKNCEEVKYLYDAAYGVLHSLFETMVDDVVRDTGAQDDLEEIFLFPENKSVFTKYADLRAKIIPHRMAFDGSYPCQIQDILRKLEVGSGQQSALHLLNKEMAKAHQLLDLAIESANTPVA